MACRPVEPDDGWTADHRQMLPNIDLGDFTALVDPDTTMRTTSGPIASTYATWFEIN